MNEVKTSNKWEKKVADQLRKDGWIVFKKGWPDFLAVRGNDIRFVEVKPPTFFRGLKMPFSDSQKIMAAIFRKYLKKEIELVNVWNEFEAKDASEISPVDL